MRMLEFSMHGGSVRRVEKRPAGRDAAADRDVCMTEESVASVRFRVELGIVCNGRGLYPK